MVGDGHIGGNTDMRAEQQLHRPSGHGTTPSDAVGGAGGGKHGVDKSVVGGSSGVGLEGGEHVGAGGVGGGEGNTGVL